MTVFRSRGGDIPSLVRAATLTPEPGELIRLARNINKKEYQENS
jgi:hypothetical protein